MRVLLLILTYNIKDLFGYFLMIIFDVVRDVVISFLSFLRKV